LASSGQEEANQTDRERCPTAGRKRRLRPSHPSGHLGTGGWGTL